MTQVSGTAPALSDGVGTSKKKAKRKVVSARLGVKAMLDKLHQQVKGT